MNAVRYLALAAAAAAAAATLTACHVGGQYAPESTMLMDVDRGSTNGRMFDFVSNRAEGDDWNIRIRGPSMYVSYGDNAKVKDLGTTKLTKKEMNEVWDRIEKVDIPDRKKGKKDDDLGYVELRLREPNDDQSIGDYATYTIYIPRDNDNLDDDVLDLFDYLQTLIKRHYDTEPNF